jgi:D-beta-D-heptose 7-phosphate kinase/D-beta-D-heptose 1-phosphate adenosyltransferase
MNILVIGDIMIDINHYVNITRKAPEADISIYKVNNTEYKLGGAANVVNNLKLLNNNVELISVIGNDYYGKYITELLDKMNIKNKLFIDDKRNTTQKNRLFHDNKLVNRHDIEDDYDINEEIQSDMLTYIKNTNNYSAIILSDYDKGLLTHNLCQNIISFCNENNIYTFVDPKIKNIMKYKNCFCLKPNMNEAIILANETDIDNIFKNIFNKLNVKNVIITNAEKGLYLNESNNIININKKFNVIDVTGAGDIFLSVLTSSYLKNKDLFLSSKIANYIASKSIEYIGNYNIKEADINEYYLYENNIIYEHEIDKIELLHKIHSNIIFTNGCFDIFHSAHLRLLNFCKKENGIFILGLNSDKSIKKIKGENRPINNLNERIELLNNLNLIDYIIIFDNESPYNILKHLKPNIIVKGGDYNVDTIIGKEFCKEIKLFNYINGISTTNIIKRAFDKLA